MNVRMPAAAERLYQDQLRNATEEQFNLALLLHAAAFDGVMPVIPFPVYMRQAMYLSQNGCRLTGWKEEPSQ